MDFLYRLFKIDVSKRENRITAVSGLNIAVNLLVASVKVLIGVISSSIAIISEGINNATDALTSVLTFIGTKLAGKHPDEKHPFGYGRIEYLTGLIISVLITVTGIEMLISSVKLIFEPDELSVSYSSLIIVSVTALIKFFLGNYTVKEGKKAASDSLIAVGKDCVSDSYSSAITIASSLIFLIFGISLDAYVGVFISLLILKVGIEVLLGTVSELIGRPGEYELARKLYKEIRSTDGILNAADMMLHNYGPESYSGSVNVEIDHDMTVGEIYRFIHELQLRIMHEYNVTMVFGIYAVDNDGEYVREIREKVADFVKSREHVSSFHAIYLDADSNKLYCDLVVDYAENDWDSLKKDFTDYMALHFPGHELQLTIETEYV